MNWHASKSHTRGFRLSVVDVIVIIALCLLAWVVHAVLPESTLYLVPLYVGFTFFLFCNVFRIGNRLEAIWYVPFTAVAAYAVYTGQMERLWWLVWWVFEPLKWLLVGYRIVKGPYTGVFGERLTRAFPNRRRRPGRRG